MNKKLQRELGTGGAVLLGLGSILGTGVFVSLAVAAGVAGPAVLAAVGLAAGLAMCNAMSSAQLAAAHPVAGGTYAYGYRYLTPALGFTAGWMFLTAKSASAATAALGAASYLLLALDQPVGGWLTVGIALALVAGVTTLVLSGLRRSNAANAVIVTLTIGVLLAFVVAGLPEATAGAGERLADTFRLGPAALLHAAALVFVAFTGYGRIATLGEEVRDPGRTIPKAIAATVLITATLYALVSFVGVAALGAAGFARAGGGAAPLEDAARAVGGAGLAGVVGVGAIVAMLGVLLNLVLGLSRVALAMGREGDLPRGLAKLDAKGKTPVPAVLLVAAIVTALTLVGSIETAWTFSAVTVLVYYGITNAAALRLPLESRRYPRWVSWLGLSGCVGLAAFVPWPYIVAAVGLIAAGLAWRWSWRTYEKAASSQ